MTQLIKQYQSIKVKYPDAILLFRIGDYYKTFDEDAKIVEKQLGISLKKVSQTSYIKATVSLPFHSIDNAMQKLVRAGYRVAICQQLENPKKTKRIVKRGVRDVLKS